MGERSEFRFRVTLLIDELDHRSFNTTEVMNLSKPLPQEVKRNRIDNILNLMQCLKRLTRGRRGHPSEWIIKAEPGDVCEGCHFFKFRSGEETLACGRIENPNPLA